MAILYRDNVAPARFAAMYNLIADVAEYHADRDRRLFWAEVLEYLSE
ncbi:MAG: hypothetical protein AB7Q17_06780 [Phycisphaerae bacterium]